MPDRIGDLIMGDKVVWDAFIDDFAPLIHSAVAKTLKTFIQAPDAEDISDIFQEVFLRLIKNDFNLLRSYDRTKASMATWLTIVARSASIDFLRRNKACIREAGNARADFAANPSPSLLHTVIPPDLLTPRQMLVMHLLYDKEMRPDEVAESLGVEVQTVRSTRHKAIGRMRRHFGISEVTSPVRSSRSP